MQNYGCIMCQVPPNPNPTYLNSRLTISYLFDAT